MTNKIEESILKSEIERIVRMEKIQINLEDAKNVPGFKDEITEEKLREHLKNSIEDKIKELIDFDPKNDLLTNDRIIVGFAKEFSKIVTISSQPDSIKTVLAEGDFDRWWRLTKNRTNIKVFLKP
jgi:hypothetical protein